MARVHHTLIAELEAMLSAADAAGFSAAAERCIQAAVSPVKLVEIAIKARNAGLAESSETMLRKLISKLGEAPKAVYVELAFQQRRKGNFAEAAALLQHATTLDGPDSRTSLSTVHMLFANGNHDEAEALLDGVAPKGERELCEAEAMRQFGRYLQAFPLPRVLDMLAELKARNSWMQQREYGPFVAEACRKKTAFSLIRLGDGEGSCIMLDPADEESFGALYALNRQNRISVWFGADFKWQTNGFLQSCAELPGAIDEADLLAIPDAGWLRHSYQISSTTGIPSLVNILRLLLSRDPSLPKLRLCTHAAHVELYQHGYMEKIIRTAKNVSVVSCLPDLPAALKAGFDLNTASLFQIPGEHGSRKALGEAVDFGTHYPDAFERLTADLSVPHGGKLFLIAGGFLGKLYASTIRRHGGVALDIGSLVDSWMGRKTRPGDDSALRLGAAPAQHVKQQIAHGEARKNPMHASEAYLEDRFRKVKGMSSRTAALVSCRLMRDQTEQGTRGHLAEIGVYEGRFFIGLALCMQPNERAVAIDVFDWPDAGVRDRFLANCAQNGVLTDIVTAHKMSSGEMTTSSLRALTGGPIRFMHIDGAHGYDAVAHDLRLVKPLLHVGGIICLDDVLHPQFPELTIAVSDFLKASPGFHLFAVIDRESFAASCKFLICRNDFVETYKTSLRTHFTDHVMHQQSSFFCDKALIISAFAA